MAKATDIFNKFNRMKKKPCGETFSTVQHKHLNCQRYEVWQGQIHIGKDRSSMRLSCTVLQDFPWQPARRSTERCSRRGALYLRKSDVKCNRSQFLNTFCESCPRFLMVSPVPRQCRKWLERCEAHQQWDGRDRWFTVLQELSFCRRCRSHPHKDPAKVCWRCAISDAKLAEFGLPWFAQIDQIKQQAEVASVSVA